MANVKKAVRKVKKAAKTGTARLGRLHPVARLALTGIAGLTGKGRGARRLPPGYTGAMEGLAGLKPKKTLASKGTRGLPEQQEARRRRVSAALVGLRASGTPEAYQKMWKASQATKRRGAQRLRKQERRN